MHIIEALEARDTELAERLVRDHALTSPTTWTHVDHRVRPSSRGPESD